MRFHLLDRIEEIRYGRHITAVKCVALADDVFNEHFPGHPVFPGSLILEGLAQLGGSFFELMMEHDGMPVRQCVLSIVNRMKFRRPVLPGDKMHFRAELTSRQEAYGVVNVRAEVDGELCAEGELTFVFLAPLSEEMVRGRLSLYDICMKNTRVVP